MSTTTKDAPAAKTPDMKEKLATASSPEALWTLIKRDATVRAALTHAGFINKKGDEVCTPAEMITTLQIAKRYGLDIFMGHLVPLEGKVYTTRDGYLCNAHKGDRLNGIDADAPQITDALGVPATVDPFEWVIENCKDRLTDAAHPPTRHEWRTRVCVYRRGHDHAYAFTGRYPFWQQRSDWANDGGANRKVFKRWVPHVNGAEMATKCGEAAGLRRGFDFQLPTVEEMSAVSGLGGTLRDIDATISASPTAEDGDSEKPGKGVNGLRNDVAASGGGETPPATTGGETPPAPTEPAQGPVIEVMLGKVKWADIDSKGAFELGKRCRVAGLGHDEIRAKVSEQVRGADVLDGWVEEDKLLASSPPPVKGGEV